MIATVTDDGLRLGASCAHLSHVRRARAEYRVEVTGRQGDKLTVSVCPKHVSWPMDHVREIEMAARIKSVKAKLAEAKA